MKAIINLLLLIVFFSSCSNPEDCAKSSGAMTTKEFSNLVFDKILVTKGINLVIQQGTTYKVLVAAGQNLIDDIEVSVQNGQLRLKDNTSCNWFREYGQTTITVTTPTLTEIYSKTEGRISSQGILKYPSLNLIAVDNYDGKEGSGTGDYDLKIENQNLELSNNSFANFFITGKTYQLTISLYEGNGKVDAQNFVAQTVQIYHRGSNTIRVNPVLAIRGDLFNIGNVFCRQRPPVVQVTAHFSGNIYF